MDQMARDLGVTLCQQYGAKRHYRPADVYASGAVLGLSGALLGYGLALYCTREDFEHFNHGLFGTSDYDQLRGEFDAPERYSQLSSDSGPRQPEATDAVGGAGEIPDASDSGGGGE